MLSKVYINFPVSVVAGGVESLVQLCDAINNLGGESILLCDSLPTTDDIINKKSPIPEKYHHYNLKHSWMSEYRYVEDLSNNWIIYPEIWTNKIGDFKNMKKAIWWLSVDYNYGKFKDFGNSDIIHFYQSFYALDFLQKNKATSYLPLFDYISHVYTDSKFNIFDKKDIVCYNPSKGINISNQVISQNTEINFVPIINMGESEAISLLKSSKVYMDFGEHPGRDRIPRESAILGNCIITNMKGSANFYNDIPIGIQYKISDFSQVESLIKNCLNNFDSNIKNFSIYRSNIRHQKEQLFNLVRQAFFE